MVISLPPARLAASLLLQVLQTIMSRHPEHSACGNAAPPRQELAAQAAVAVLSPVWLPVQVLEQIMFKYVDLCIELKKGRHAKDGLIHYRNICQQVRL